MALIYFGEKDIPVGLDQLLVNCPSCETDQFADVLVVSRYLHVYWVPIVPTEKVVHITCRKCGLKRYNITPNSQIITDYDLRKHHYPHPWYTFSGVIIFILLIVIMVIIASNK